MSKLIELKIQKLLIELEDQERVADALLKEWDRKKLKESEVRTVAFFLCNTGLAPSLLERINRLIESEQKVFWDIYSEVLSSVPHFVNEKVGKALVDAALEEEFEIALLHNKRIEHFIDRINLLVGKYKDDLENAYEERQRELIDQVQFLSTQRLIEEEKKALDLLSHLSPNSKQHIDLFEDFKDRWARHIITLRQTVEKNNRMTQKVRDEWHKEVGEAFSIIFEDIKNKSEKNSQAALDLSLIAYFMDFTKEALEIAELAESSPAKDWLFAELLLENRRYIDLLEWTNQLEVKYASDPDALFATSYLKAKAYWGVGQPTTAIDLMTSIVQVRPTYRSAFSLLQEWQGGGK